MAEAIKLGAVFAALMLGLGVGGRQWIAVLCGMAAAAALFGMAAGDALRITLESFVSRMTVVTVLAFYAITVIQRMLERRGQLDMAQRSLGGIFNNRRVNAALAPVIIGILPSPGAVTICGTIVDKAAGDWLTTEEKTFVTSYFRHIPEAVLPTYASIIIGLELSGVPLSSFLIGMLPMVAALFLLGHFFYLRRLPVETGLPRSGDKRRDAVNLAASVWSIVLCIALVVFFESPVYLAVLSVACVNVFVNRFSPGEMLEVLVDAFETKLIVTTALILAFKDIIVATGAMSALPTAFAALPIPLFLTHFLLFFFGTLLVGQQATSVIGLPLAFATVPDAGAPLFILLMGCGYASMQISPTHVCLAVVTGHFKTGFGSLVRLTLPVIGSFLAILLGYYLLLTAVL